MSMNPAKPPGYFGRQRAAERRLKRFLRYGGEINPERPEPIAEWSLVPGAADGQVIVTIVRLGDPGDAVYWGDGRGQIIDIVWQIDAPQVSGALGSGAEGASYMLTLPDLARGQSISFSVAAVGTSGFSEWVDLPVLVPGTPPDPEDPEPEIDIPEGFAAIIEDIYLDDDDGIILTEAA